ncbi:bifunctional phosphoribosyl-AMP cyclohydrolase/phosphoribosyl-ATP diphosphatase HisIE [Thermithiobacillus plumbiphilus]|uniref:Histidine biosynthesis bifunctional protein HisIE n=1 Tax=Thermithiobacillus plumbiphilus TaxID=1729899 RepID=A0ABU9D5W8_9PROT
METVKDASCSLLDSIKWDAAGLAPAIAQEARTGEVLMLAYMNRESLAATLRDGYATYYSRSRGQLWRKGETSGHLQRLVDVRLDCDGDTLLLRVEQTGPACHTGADTCFFRRQQAPGSWQDASPPPAMILQSLCETLSARRLADPGQSYVARLMHDGRDKILKKVGEEAAETIIAAKNGDPGALVYESADLLFHLLVMLVEQDLHIDAVLQELARREGMSGLAEKASRTERSAD